VKFTSLTLCAELEDAGDGQPVLVLATFVLGTVRCERYGDPQKKRALVVRPP
jgi:hypothetical protein